MSKLKLSNLKKELIQLNQKELIDLVFEIFKQNKDVQLFLSNKFLGEEAIIDLYVQTKKKIKDEFFPERGFGKLRIGEAKKEISNFKKLSSDEERTLDLMLFFVELGTKFTNTYGDIDSRFYNSMLSMYDKVVFECNKNEQYHTIFKERLYSVVQNSSGIGWGYHDTLSEIYYTLDLEFDEED